MPTVETDQHRSSRRRVDKNAAADSSAAPRQGRGRHIKVVVITSVLLLTGVAVATATHRWWWPALSAISSDEHASEAEHDADETASSMAAGDAHQESGESDDHAEGATTLTLSPQARKNIGLAVTTVQLSDYARTVSMPATVVGRPGQTDIAVSAPMTGIVTRIYPMRGEAVLPGAPMFDLRLTHEDLVEKQSSLLRYLEELDVVKREVARLDEVTASGAVAGKRLLERQYEQQKIEAALRAERQALLLHGLTEEQIEQIATTRQLLQQLTIAAPTITDDTDEHVEYLQVAEISVRMGEHVAAGTQLATVTDHCELLIEGKAFEQDADALNKAANARADVSALVNTNAGEMLEVAGLKILYVENQVERESRALKFFVRLPNELTRNELSTTGHRFIGWRYRPGQRVELLIPIEQWENQIVLPRQAVVQEGPENYVYLDCNGHFDRKAVHVQYRDQRRAVIESDGTLFPGDKVVSQGAYQIHLALKNKSGGGADPHAGHHH